MPAADNSESEADLHEEAKIMKLLTGHPNIVRLHQTVMNLGRLVVIMEYVPGVSLKQHHDLPEHMICSLFQRITDGVRDLHKMSVVHGLPGTVGIVRKNYSCEVECERGF